MPRQNVSLSLSLSHKCHLDDPDESSFIQLFDCFRKPKAICQQPPFCYTSISHSIQLPNHNKLQCQKASTIDLVFIVIPRRCSQGYDIFYRALLCVAKLTMSLYPTSHSFSVSDRLLPLLVSFCICISLSGYYPIDDFVFSR